MNSMNQIPSKNKGGKSIQTSSINSHPSTEHFRRNTWTWARQRVEFNDEQREILARQGLLPAQVDQLENTLPLIRERLIRPIPVASVREELSKLKKELTSVYKRICLNMPKSRAGGEALARLYQAQVLNAKSPHEMVTLQDLLKMANDLVECAIARIPKSRGRIVRSSPNLKGPGEIITLISRALQAAHATDRRGSANKLSVPPLDIRIGHNRPFLTISGIVSDTTGGWSVDEAIKAYRYNLKQITGPRS
jgi:hypothetical protein